MAMLTPLLTQPLVIYLTVGVTPKIKTIDTRYTCYLPLHLAE
ncbi:MAG: hypothetical protein AAFR18_16505 [Cyanobacteria bacterium J06627_32]